jgi:hypothetical protein
MRLVAVVVGFMVWCVAAAAQIPVRMGLWEVTTHTEAKASPAVAEAIKKRGLIQNPRYPLMGFSGQTVDPPTTLRKHTCFTENNWKKNKARLATAPQACIFARRFTENSYGMSSSVRCGDNTEMIIAIDSKLAWPTREKMHLTVRSVVTFRGVAGESMARIEVTSLFLSPNCGPVSPGESVPVK